MLTGNPLDPASDVRRRLAFRRGLGQSDLSYEFIAGLAIRSGPTSHLHNCIVGRLRSMLHGLACHREGWHTGGGRYLVATTHNDYLPDVCAWGPAKSSNFAGDTEIFPPPDLVVEVLSDNTVVIDRSVKFEDYGSHGVAEYWIVDPAAQVLEQYRLKGDRYNLEVKAADGTLISPLLGGIEFPIRAVFDEAIHTATLEKIWRS